MKRMVRIGAGATLLALGVIAALAASKTQADKALFAGRKPGEAAQLLLLVAETQAGKGTWERLGVARVHYLSGNKARGQELIDAVMKGKVDESDWMRLGRIYTEAKEWEKAKAAFEKAIAADPKDAGNLAEIGAWYNLRGERARAEELFEKALALKPSEVWVTSNIAGSYVDVEPR
jgi:tetratricopeptide (TPR) repeat protein